MTANELTYFTVNGYWYDVESPDTSGSTNAAQFLVVSALVNFKPRLAPGTVIYVPNLDIGNSQSGNVGVSLATIQARIYEGQLQTINQGSSVGVQLVANTTILGLTSPLIYDVSFTNVVYAGEDQVLQNFAFTAPTTAATVDLGDPTLTRLQYDPTNYG